MPKKKKKSIRKNKKKPARPAKRTRGKTSARKKKPVTSQNRTIGVLAVEVSEVEMIRGVESVPGADETDATTEDALDEHFLPEYGGSE